MPKPSTQKRRFRTHKGGGFEIGGKKERTYEINPHNQLSLVPTVALDLGGVGAWCWPGIGCDRHAGRSSGGSSGARRAGVWGRVALATGRRTVSRRTALGRGTWWQVWVWRWVAHYGGARVDGRRTVDHLGRRVSRRALLGEGASSTDGLAAGTCGKLPGTLLCVARRAGPGPGVAHRWNALLRRY